MSRAARCIDTDTDILTLVEMMAAVLDTVEINADVPEAETPADGEDTDIGSFVLGDKVAGIGTTAVSNS
jgi:hypothetical protein